jgi:peptidoglycan/LPS O-acetylase OafA/YrhL
VLTGLLLIFPFAEIMVENTIYQFDKLGIGNTSGLLHDGWSIAVLILIILLIHLVVIFCYKKRILQIRMLVFSIFLMIGLFGMFYFFSYFSFDNAHVDFNLVVAFPLIAIILDYMAIRAIGKDEALIRSINRIR